MDKSDKVSDIRSGEKGDGGIMENEVIKEQKETFIKLLKSTEREGVDKLINYLETKTDFFTAPASSKFHNNFDGGLLSHCLNVYKNFKSLLELRNIDYPEESIIITSLCHDLCKVNYYVKEQRNRKVDGKWESYDFWATGKNIALPLPHSSRSIRLIKSFIPLKFDEELIIFYHMGPYGGEDYEYKNLLQNVNERYPVTLLFYMADLMSSYMDESRAEN